MRSLLILFLLTASIGSERILAQTELLETQSSSPTATDSQPIAASEGSSQQISPSGSQKPSAEETQEEQLKRRKLEIGMILTSGIVFMGIFLVVIILVYGRRTRRRLATGRGASAPRDELWYLKKPRGDAAADESGPERDSP